MDDVKYLSNNGHKYVVFSVKYKNKTKIPGILDYDDFVKIQKLGKGWRCNDNGFIVCSHTTDGLTKDVNMHEVVMLLHGKKSNNKIIHINRIGLDNRMENLMYDDKNKLIQKNIKKKRRTVKLPAGSGIDVDDIPTYVWYMDGNMSHGPRFVIKIDDVTWASTSARDVPLIDKLEDAKRQLKKIIESRDDLYREYSMNGDYNDEGKRLLNSYYDMVKAAGYKYISKVIPDRRTFELLEPS